MSRTYTTVSIDEETLELLRTTTVDYHGIIMNSNSDKISALIRLYLDRYTKPQK